jgi:hypothetical protein
MHPGHHYNPDATWHDIFTSPGHTGQTWACMAIAIAHADNLLGHVARASNTTDPGLRRGGPLWTLTAAASYQLLAASGAYQHQAIDPPTRFAADEPAIHTWLRAPDPRSTGGTITVADLLEVDDNFLLDDGARPGRIARLVDQAQAAGVLRCPNMRIEVWHMADDDGDLIGHRVAVHRDGVILASEQLDATELIDESLTSIDAAVAVLRETATVATRLIATANAGSRPAQHTAGYDQVYLATLKPGWAQGFRVGGRHPTADPPAAIPDVTAAGDPATRGPHR